MTRAKWIVAVLALAAAVLAVVQLERMRTGVEITDLNIDTTPATLYRPAGADEVPVVVVAHGFAGSRQLMQAFSLTLARAGYAVLAFDFEGHGRNPVPMSGDVDAIDGTTRLLIAETRRVIDHALELEGVTRPLTLLGHSMATDIIVRAAVEEPRVDAVVAVSMFSEAVSATHPQRLLAITGEWEPGLRQAALDALRLVDPAAEEDQTVEAGGVIRRAVVAPRVEHVAVLYSEASLSETLAWVDATAGRDSDGWTAPVGVWLVVLLAALLSLAWPAAALVPDRHLPRQTPSARVFLAALILPAVVVPLIATQIETGFLPVLVADYLMLHFLLYGLAQIAILLWGGVRLERPAVVSALFVALWGIAIYGMALHRYGTNFLPDDTRLLVIAVLALGTIPFLIADALITEAGRAAFWRRIAAKLAVFGSLGLAVALDFEGLLFLLFIIPLILLFFLVFGLIGRWTGKRGGPVGAGIGLGLVLAWTLGVSFPLFVATAAG